MFHNGLLGCGYLSNNDRSLTQTGAWELAFFMLNNDLEFPHILATKSLISKAPFTAEAQSKQRNSQRKEKETIPNIFPSAILHFSL
jgi:hypothetical protein